MNILVIPDTHFSPEGSHSRMVWAGRLCNSAGVALVVHLGDAFDMGSLCTHDQGTHSFSQRNFQDDLEAGYKAFRAFDSEVKVKARKVLLGGNHDDDRLHRFLEREGRLKGTITSGVFAIDGWRWVPYQVPYVAEGITFCHSLPAGVMNRPIAGEHIASSLIKKSFTSCVVGHSHILDYSERTRADGQKLMGLSAGCFVDPKMKFSYAGLSRNLWWNGIHVLHNVKKGTFDLETWSYDRLKKAFS
jgi:predicted phosphodiesterase